MKRFLNLIVPAVLFLLVPTVASAGGWGSSKPTFGERLWFGGGIGLGFGDVRFIEIQPLVGYRVSPKLLTGVGLIYRYRKDTRVEPEYSTSDYGANAFARYMVARPVFLHGEYEYLNFEYPRLDGSSDRQGYSSLWGGVGISQPVGEKSSWFVLGLYNFLYDSNDDPRPYDSPWMIRAGFSMRF